MKKKVVLSSQAKDSLERLLLYLKQEWSEKVKQEFIEKLDNKIDQISSYPKSCPESKVYKNLYQCIFTRQTTIYYRIKEDEIEIVALFDTRKDPKDLKL